MNCAACDVIEKKKDIIFENDVASAVLVSTPATPGHVTIFPKEHQPIIEKISDDVFGSMFLAANLLAKASFEVLGAYGTNILIKNGLPAGQKIPHVQIEVIPRFEDDGLQLLWQPTKASEEELNSVQEKIQAELERKEEKMVEEKKKEEVKEVPKEEELPEEENYMIKQLQRLP